MRRIILLLTIITFICIGTVNSYADEISDDTDNISDDNNSDDINEEYINSRIDELLGRIEELELSKEEFIEKFDYYELMTSDINSNLCILITQNEDLKNTFTNVFYDDEGESYLDNIYLNSNQKVETLEDVKNFLYAGFIIEGEEIDFTETLSYKLDEMEEGITESLTVTNERTLSELNETLTTTNTFLSYLFVLILLFIGIGIACLIGWVINKVLNRNIY